MGINGMIGPSWMLPIQILFFIFMTIFGTRIFIKDEVNNEPDKSLKKRTNQNGIFLISVCMFSAIIVAIMRYVTGKPFPTALFLLIGMSIIGIYYKYANNNLLLLWKILVIFEFGFVLSVLLSYPERAFYYILAYNVGLVIFISIGTPPQTARKHTNTLYIPTIIQIRSY